MEDFLSVEKVYINEEDLKGYGGGFSLAWLEHL